MCIIVPACPIKRGPVSSRPSNFKDRAIPDVEDTASYSFQNGLISGIIPGGCKDHALARHIRHRRRYSPEITEASFPAPDAGPHPTGDFLESGGTYSRRARA